VALQQLASTRPTLILSDIEMPGMDGLTFLRLARARTQASIIILSSVATAGHPNVDKARALGANARALGANAVMAKPSGSTSYDLEQKLGAHIQRLITAFGS